ncbi:MAG: PA2779 family protein [Nitrospirota bacterium]|nr:PA2779 family protein [Nitrospirota bacterium]
MQSIRRAFYTKPLAIYLVLALIAISTAAGPAEAMYIPSAPGSGIAPALDRAADLAVIQKALETKTVQQRLVDYGLTPDEAMAKLNNLPDDQLHKLATNIDEVQAGGDVVGTLFALIIIAALVVFIIFLLEGRIQIR